MKDYENIWVRWQGFLAEDLSFRKEILDSLHLETKKGFDVITRIAAEEIAHALPKELHKKLHEAIEEQIAIGTFSGYALFLVVNTIDPVKENLVAKTQTNELGNTWMTAYEKDRMQKLLSTVDPVLLMFLEKYKQAMMNTLLGQYMELWDIPYKKTQTIDSFLNWSLHQGFLLGLLEKQLSQKNE